LAGTIERAEAAVLLGTTERTVIALGWVSGDDLVQLRASFDDAFGGALVVDDLGSSRDAPVLLRNPRPARPFEQLVAFLSLPRSGSLDPTVLMALFMPLLFGAMVGDIGYGLVLGGLAWMLRQHGPEVARAAGVVLGLGATWSVVFGLLYGELFGSVGHSIGLHALWFYRGGSDALVPLLLFSLAIGFAHVGLGLVLGVLQAGRDREPRTLLERIGTLAVLASLLVAAGATAGQLPRGARTPAVAVAVVAIVLVLSLHGALGLITGPLDLLGRFGNVLSYLRVAAIGLASVYLATVANVLATKAPLLLGILVAIFFHTLNLALASFSPTIQALRLHYVEFFNQFYEPGGRAFRAFGSGTPETGS
jgi:V/A-type H+/Na+-transporting ATPase subunit I